MKTMAQEFLNLALTRQDYFAALPGWLHDSLSHHLQELHKHPFPTAKQDAFRYTDLSNIRKHLVVMQNSLDSTPKTLSLPPKISENAIRLVFHNQQFQPALSDIHLLPKGVIACSLQEALSQHTAKLQMAWPRGFDGAYHPFACLNLALSQDGFFMYIPPEMTLVEPIHFLHVLDQADLQLITNALRIVMLDEKSRMALFEEYIDAGCVKNFNNNLQSICLQKYAKLDHALLQHIEDETLFWLTTDVTLQEGADAQFASCLVRGNFMRHDLICRLEKPFATCQTRGYYHARRANYIDNHVEILHLAPNTTSDMLYKGTLTDTATAVFNGRLYVDKLAQKIVAHQENHHLLFSNAAQSYAKPELEIYADDVKCKHGATTALFDQEALFYLRSRGLNEQAAKQLLLNAFINTVFDPMSLPLTFIQYIKSALQEVSHDI